MVWLNSEMLALQKMTEMLNEGYADDSRLDVQ